MKFKFHLWDKSILFRLIFTFLIILIPVYFMGISTYNWGINTVRQELLKSLTAQMEFYVMGLENDIERTKILQYDLFVDDDLNKLADIIQIMNEYEISMSMKRLRQRLITVKSSSNYIDNVSIFIASLNKKISANEGIMTSSRNEFNKGKYEEYINLPQLYIFNGHIYIEGWYPPSTIKEIAGSSFQVEIELSKTELTKALEQFNTYEGSGAIIFGQDLNIIAENINESISTDRIKEILIKLNDPDESIKQTVQIEDKRYLIMSVASSYLNFVFLRFIPEDRVFETLAGYRIWFWLFSALAVAIIVFFSFSTYRFIQRPIIKLVKSFRKLEKGDLNFSISHNHDDEFGQLYKGFNTMLSKLGGLIDQLYKQKILAQRSELKQLQSQINPHFLYNSFYMLHRMILSENYENAVQVSQKLGNYFQFITRSAADEVRLASEFEHAGIYAEMQAMRFSSRIKVHFRQLPDKYGEIIVPRLILQPLLENSIEHGMKDIIENGIVSVELQESENSLLISVEDNGDGVSDEELQELEKRIASEDEYLECTGVINIHRRIRIKFGLGSGLIIGRSWLGGFKAVIKIPLGEGGHV